MLLLKTLCFDFIVQNFERLYYALTLSKDENVQRNFQFLQRRFSIQLLTALYEDKKLKDEYFKLLINEHLNVLVGNWFENSRYLNCMESVFCNLPNLTRICFKECGNEILENVVKFCPKIVEIDARHSNVTDDGVKYLYEIRNGMLPCPELKNLFIKSCLVTDAGGKCLIQNLPSLEKFDYPNLPLLLYSIYKRNVTFIKKILKTQKVLSFNLAELNLSEFQRLSYYTDVLKTCLTICPNLESIACYIMDNEQLHLFENSQFKNMYLYYWPNDRCPVININNILKKIGCNLISLKIANPPSLDDTNCNISVSVLAVHCPALKKFYAYDINFIDDDADGCLQVTFPFLTKCCFSNIFPFLPQESSKCHSGVKAVCLILSSSPKLESVSFRFTYRLPPEVKSEILMWCKTPSAKLIEFVHLNLEKELIKDILVNSPHLKAMFLNRCKIGFHEDINSILQTFSEKQYIKAKIFFQKDDPFMSDMDELHVVNFDTHNAIFNNSIRNLENYLREEFKLSSISDFLFSETVFDGFYRNPGDDWEKNWKIISF